ncbi:phosphatidylinositol 4-phosphate 5-kinase type-1 beta-like [Physella acuta]|uniref:phosphatidylinositol 4-phosphate 5-kinase type-1 beta-like n=1 Tax=Physella acuta TaxID=109671 RepID=UPI0027DB6F0F|nr:phosphatidylinositol 4-phosphate 5-kinase type-1 beta-like [Physella acuta]
MYLYKQYLLRAVCVCPLREIANPGASGSAFYFSHNNEFIIKTVSIKEAKFLVQLLPQYFMNIQENKQTLLPKFYGLYQYKSGCKTITFVIMNNWLPSSLSLQEKYDIKGSTYGRKASVKECQKSSPTFKDLDLLEHHAKGFLLDKEIYKALIQTLTRDCRVLESFKIMDYSLLIGVYKTDGSFGSFHGDLTDGTDGWEDVDECVIHESTNAVFLTQNGTISSLTAEGRSSINPLASRNRISLFSTPLEAIALDCNLDFTDGQEEPQDIPPGGIPALNADGEQVFIFLGIIDILQSYGVKKRLEYFFKSLYSNRNTISVNPPDKYKSRFLTFQTKVFTYDQQGD